MNIITMEEELILYINSEIFEKAEIYAMKNDTTVENLVVNIIKEIALRNTDII